LKREDQLFLMRIGNFVIKRKLFRNCFLPTNFFARNEYAYGIKLNLWDNRSLVPYSSVKTIQ
jgi:hypothetical protein